MIPHWMGQQGERIVDKSRLGQDLDELNEQRPVDHHEGPLSAREMAGFQAVAAAMTAVLEEAEVDRASEQLTPALRAVIDKAEVEHAIQALAPDQRVALELLYTAATAHDADRGTYVSALERSTMLNQALMALQPVLALGLRPDFREGRSVYQELVGLVNEVRSDITTGIWSQMMPRRKKQAAPVKDEDEDDAGEETPETPEGDSKPGAEGPGGPPEEQPITVPDPDINTPDGP